MEEERRGEERRGEERRGEERRGEKRRGEERRGDFVGKHEGMRPLVKPRHTYIG
jgi:hypothetical protein